MFIRTAIFSLSILFTTLLSAQCSLNGEYANLFEIETYDIGNGSKTLISRIAKVDESKCYAKAVNAMPEFFGYLKTNFSADSLYRKIDLSQDSTALQKSFEAVLMRDKELKSTLDQYVFKSLGSFAKDTIVFEEVQDVATKFFWIKGLNDKNQYEGKVCVGVNLIEQTMPKRRPYLEAFAFAAIISEMKNENSNILGAFKESMKELYNHNLGVDKEDRLLRAQGMMMLLMKNNNIFNAVLATYYAKNHEHLPFVIRSVK